MGIKKNEQLILEINPELFKIGGKKVESKSYEFFEKVEYEFEELKVKGDGSCLFNSITLAMEDTVFKSQETRQLIAGYILSNPKKYTKDFLGDGKTP